MHLVVLVQHHQYLPSRLQLGNFHRSHQSLPISKPAAMRYDNLKGAPVPTYHGKLVRNVGFFIISFGPDIKDKS